jgi:WD40 repeat protein
MPGLIDAQRLWRFEKKWQGRIGDYVQDLVWNTDGSYLAAASISGPISIMHTADGSLAHTLAGHTLGTLSLAFGQDPTCLASGGQDGRMKLWDLRHGACTLSQPGGADWVDRVAWSTSGRYLAWTGGTTCYLHDHLHGRVLDMRGEHAATISDLMWAPKEDLLASAIYGGVCLWKPDESNVHRSFRWQGASIRLRWSPNQRFIATGDQDASVHFWFVETGVDLRMSGFPGKVRLLSWDQTSRYLATGSMHCIAVWDCSGQQGPEGKTPIMLEGIPSAVRSLAYQHAGSFLATGYQNGSIALWDPAGCPDALFATSLSHAEIVQTAWSPDDRLLAVGTDAGDIAVFELSRKKQPNPPRKIR